MTAHEALLWFGISVPVACVLFILLDHLGRRAERGRFVPRRYPPAATRAERRAARRADGRTELPARHARDQRPVLEPPAVEPPDAAHEVHAVPAVHALVASLRPPRPVRRPWAPGDGLRRPIAGGAEPSAATVRKRAWTTYSMIAPRDIFGVVNAERLERGRPPLRFNPLTESIEPMQIDVDDVGRVRVHWTDADDIVDPYEIARAR